MKLFKIEKSPKIVRISFNAHVSVTFEETTIDEVYELALKVFKDVHVANMIVEHNVLEKPQPKKKTLLQVREEGIAYSDSKHKGPSKSKTLYGINEEEAKKHFLENYEHYMQ